MSNFDGVSVVNMN